MKFIIISTILCVLVFSCNSKRNNSLQEIMQKISTYEKCEFNLVSDEIKKEMYLTAKCDNLNEPDFGRILLDFGQQFIQEKIQFNKLGIKDKSGKIHARFTPNQIKTLHAKRKKYNQLIKLIEEEKYTDIYNQLNENLSKMIVESDFVCSFQNTQGTLYKRFDGFVIGKRESQDYVSFYSSANNSNINIVLSLDPKDDKIYGLTTR